MKSMKVIKYISKPCLDAVIEINGKQYTYIQAYGEIKFLDFYNNNRDKWYDIPNKNK